MAADPDSQAQQARLPFEKASLNEDLRIWSCVVCRKRKVRCDRRDPCNNCTKNSIECQFPVAGRLPRRSRDPTASKSQSQRQTELIGRLRHLEAVVTELTAQVEDSPKNQSADGYLASSTQENVRPGSSTGQSLLTDAESATVGQSCGEIDEDLSKLVVDRDGELQTEKGFWSSFCDEVEHIFQAVQYVVGFPRQHQATSQDGRSEASGSVRSHHQAFVLGTGFSRHFEDVLSPLPSQMLFIWRTYVENVDPFVKVLHVPTTDIEVRAIRGNLSTLESDTEALMFAITLAAIASMNEADATTNFSASKPQLLARYRLGTEQALARAEYLTPKSLTVLQAFVIYVSILPYTGAGKLGWPLSGLALRIAASLGLHQENFVSKSCRPPTSELDAELRRRLWWQICLVESQTQLPGASELLITEAMFSTKHPAHIDDTELNSMIVGQENSKKGLKDTTLCLIRCEIWHLNRSLRMSSIKTLDGHIQVFQAARSKIQDKYLRGVQREVVFDSFVHTMATLFFAKVELIICHQHLHQSKMAVTSPSPDVYNMVLTSSLTIIETVRSLRNEPGWAQWRWQLRNRVPWHALSIVLSQICHRPWSEVSETGLSCVSCFIEDMSEHDICEPLYQPLSNLLARAQQKRAQSSHHMQDGFEHTRQINRESGKLLLNREPTDMLPFSLSDGANDRGWLGCTGPSLTATPATPSKETFDWDMLHGSIDLAPYSITASGSGDGTMGERQEMQWLDNMPFDWEAWDEIAGIGDQWTLNEL